MSEATYIDEEIDLNRRGSLEREIAGALKNAIHAHGPITQNNIPSAAKRVIQVIKLWNRQQRQQRSASPP